MDHTYGREKEKAKRITTYCCVPQCCNYQSEGISFHHFPKDCSLKKKWEIALKMGKPASKSSRVCGTHFTPDDYFPTAKKQKHLKRHVCPSVNLPVRSHDRKVTSPLKNQMVSRAERLRHRNERLIETDEEADDNDLTYEEAEDSILHDDSNPTAPEISGDMDKEASASAIELSTRDVGIQVNVAISSATEGQSSGKSSTFSLASILMDKYKLYTFTGINSLDLLNGIAEYVSDLTQDSMKKKKELPLLDRVVLTFVKLRLNLTFSALAILFGVSRHTCAKYFKDLMPPLVTVLKTVIPWPSKEDILGNMPISFKNFKATRIVLDCAETPVEGSKCIKCRILTYSQYKKGHTLKFKIGVTPSGLITSISQSYGGRASDKFIVNDCGVLEKLEFNDGVMVDKGFMIEGECLQRHLTLIRPPFLSRKKQLSRSEALKSAEIARARVHVERVIQRLREFDNLKKTSLMGSYPLL